LSADEVLPMSQPPRPSQPPQERRIRQALRALQDRLAAALGVAPSDREATVKSIMERTQRGGAGYWLQLFLAMGIASLGLVLGSTAVVIGAMLISPLMGPIVELGMGLAIGSPFLVMRSFARTGVSIFVVVSAAAVLTSLLPFHEVTAEISARTSPTVLDLLIAIFCAISAAYTTMRPGNDTSATAAGTAIGIALVPPLCVIGYGIGAGSRAIAGGAALLFTANFCAILLFAVISFLLVGYSAVGVGEMEVAELDQQKRGAVRSVARALKFVFGSKYGSLLRVLMPLVLLGSVYFPLREALVQVTWQVRVRTAIQQMVASLPQSTVRSSIVVERHAVVVRLFTLGRAEDAAKLELELKEKIAAIAGVVPRVEVLAVPDAATLQSMAAELRASAVHVPPPPPQEPNLGLLRAQLGDAVLEAWPAAAGPLLRWSVELPARGATIVEVVHLGPGLGASGTELLGQALASRLDAPVVVRDRAIPAEPVSAAAEEGLAWLPKAMDLLAHLDDAEGLYGCIEEPTAPKGKALPNAAAVSATLRGSRAFGGARVEVTPGSGWMAVVSTSPCAKPASAIADGGAPADASADASADAADPARVP
jgi:uncharacterized hydrophobic protein (TIGR00271 family)